MFLMVSIDQPAGTVNVAPPGVTRGVSADTRSPACGDAGAAQVKVGLAAKGLNATKATTAIREVAMEFT